MKTILKGAMALMMLVGLMSCGAAKKAAMQAAATPQGMVEEVLPLSGIQYQSDTNFFRATQNGVSTDRGTAQKIAMQNCRQALAANVQSALQLVIENYLKNQNTELSSEVKSQYQELAYTVVNQTLVDIQVVEEKLYRQEDGTFAHYVCLQMSKDALAKAAEAAMAKAAEEASKAAAEDAKLKLEFDLDRFKEIYKEQMDNFKNQ